MKKILSLLLVTAFVLTSCSDEFFDINKSPNKATEDNMTPSLVLPRAMHRIAAFPVTDYDVYMRWMGYWARCSGTYGPNTDEEAYMLTSSFNRNSWLVMYDILKDFDVIEKNAKLRNETAYEAMAKIMKSIGFMQLVDQYNNVPYSKAFDLSNYMLTPYDKGEDIYAALIADLEAADALLASYSNDAAAAAANLDLAKSDIMFKGSITKWRKFCNTQRLRLVMHQTDFLTATALKTHVDKIVANGVGFLGTGETAEVQAGYVLVPALGTYSNDAGSADLDEAGVAAALQLLSIAPDFTGLPNPTRLSKIAVIVPSFPLYLKAVKLFGVPITGAGLLAAPGPVVGTSVAVNSPFSFSGTDFQFDIVYEPLLVQVGGNAKHWYLANVSSLIKPWVTSIVEFPVLAMEGMSANEHLRVQKLALRATYDAYGGCANGHPREVVRATAP